MTESDAILDLTAAACAAAIGEIIDTVAAGVDAMSIDVYAPDFSDAFGERAIAAAMAAGNPEQVSHYLRLSAFVVERAADTAIAAASAFILARN